MIRKDILRVRILEPEGDLQISYFDHLLAQETQTQMGKMTKPVSKKVQGMNLDFNI